MGLVSMISSLREDYFPQISRYSFWIPGERHACSSRTSIPMHVFVDMSFSEAPLRCGNWHDAR